MSVSTYTADDLIIDVPVTFDAGAVASSLAGATVEAVAKQRGGAAIEAATEIDADTIRLTFDAGVLAAGVYQTQVRATIGGKTQTVAAFQILVSESN